MLPITGHLFRLFFGNVSYICIMFTFVVKLLVIKLIFLVPFFMFQCFSAVEMCV